MTKVISLSDDAYEGLKSLKSESDSFSDVVRRLTAKEKKKSILEFAGKLAGTKEEREKIKRIIYEDRKKQN